MGMQRLRQDSSSGSEFDFELPPVKKKINDSGIVTDISQSSPGVDTKPQESMSEQKTVVIETPPTTTILMTPPTDLSTVNSIATSTKKIIEYKEVPVNIFNVKYTGNLEISHFISLTNFLLLTIEPKLKICCLFFIDY